MASQKITLQDLLTYTKNLTNKNTSRKFHSFYYSIFNYLLKDSTEKYIDDFIEHFISRLKIDIIIKRKEFNYPIENNQLILLIDNNSFNDYLLIQYISNYLQINIFILDKKNIIFTTSSTLVPFKKNIILINTNYGENFEFHSEISHKELLTYSIINILNGEKTQSENIADIVGLKQAFFVS